VASGCFLGSREAGDRGGAQIAPCDVALEKSSEGGRRNGLGAPKSKEGGARGVLWVVAAFWQRKLGGKSGGAKSAVARFPEVKPRKPQWGGFWDGLWLLSRHQGGGESKGEVDEGQRKPGWPKSWRKRGEKGQRQPGEGPKAKEGS